MTAKGFPERLAMFLLGCMVVRGGVGVYLTRRQDLPVVQRRLFAAAFAALAIGFSVVYGLKLRPTGAEIVVLSRQNHGDDVWRAHDHVGSWDPM